MFSCQGEKGKSSVVNNDTIACNVLGVSLNDNPRIISEKLTKGGYQWEETLNISGPSTIALKDTFSFSGVYFDHLYFDATNNHLNQICISKECDSLWLAQDAYDEVCNKFKAKYSQFIVDKEYFYNDQELNCLEFDDGKTHLFISLFHHKKEEISEFYDEERKHRAREHWRVLIYYTPRNKVKNE